MAYCTAAEVRVIANISTTRVDDTNMATLINEATISLNRDIGIRVENEYVSYIDTERENDVDGVNTTFYLRNCGRGYEDHIGDRNDDGDVTTADITFYSLSSDGTRSTYTVSSVDDAALGKFTLTTAPTNGHRAYVSYVSFPLAHDSTLVKRACKYLSAAIAYDYLEFGQFTRFKSQGIQIFRHTDAGDKFLERYDRTVNSILSSRIARVDPTNFKTPLIPEIGD
jgi:hypothetical protein